MISLLAVPTYTVRLYALCTKGDLNKARYLPVVTVRCYNIKDEDLDQFRAGTTKKDFRYDFCKVIGAIAIELYSI